MHQRQRSPVGRRSGLPPLHRLDDAVVNNAGNVTTPASAIFDAFGNQLDGEFLGYQDANGKFVNLMPTGQIRGSGASAAAS